MHQERLHIIRLQGSLVGHLLALPLVFFSFINELLVLELHFQHLLIVRKLGGLIILNFLLELFVCQKEFLVGLSQQSVDQHFSRSVDQPAGAQ
jgi:hypothetical protein